MSRVVRCARLQPEWFETPEVVDARKDAIVAAGDGS